MAVSSNKSHPFPGIYFKAHPLKEYLSAEAFCYIFNVLFLGKNEIIMVANSIISGSYFCGFCYYLLRITQRFFGNFSIYVIMVFIL